MTAPPPGLERVALLGTGLVGGSVGLALRAAGIQVRGFDVDSTRSARAADLGAIDVAAGDVAGATAHADLVVVAVPVAHVADLVIAALDAGAPAVTDVGSVKTPVLDAVARARPRAAPRFVGGHPMAGSEQDGVDAADGALFLGATWVLTPTERTDPAAFATARTMVGAVGAEVVVVSPEHHDRLVAVVSHVPQLAATTLMDVASTSGEGPLTLLRLAAGGFRDMTRIAASHPGIWPDICVANRDAIVAALDEYLEALGTVRAIVDTGDRARLLELLERARHARRNLPVGAAAGEPLAELRVPVPDRPGVLAEVTTLPARLGVNIFDFEIVHSAEGGAGVLVLVVPESGADAVEAGLADAGYHPVRSSLE